MNSLLIRPLASTLKKLKTLFAHFLIKQTIKMSLPKFFCVDFAGSYKVYLNTLYKDANIIWPQKDIVSRTMTMKMRNDTSKKVSYRKWNGSEYKYISWAFTGSSIDMTLNERQITITCPVVQVSDATLLPFNTCSTRPSREVILDNVDYSNYEKADVYERDPNSPEYNRHTPQVAPVNVVPVEQNHAFVMTCYGGACSTNVKPEKKGLPPHVARLILADAISKNEDCPISCETITIENGSVTSCGHVFCKSSLDDWFKIKDECPVCKQPCL